MVVIFKIFYLIYLNYENNNREFSVEMLNKIVKVFNVNLVYFLGI